jgi:hypothetical protein
VECEDAGLLEFDGPPVLRYKSFRRQTLKIQTADLKKKPEFGGSISKADPKDGAIR